MLPTARLLSSMGLLLMSVLSTRRRVLPGLAHVLAPAAFVPALRWRPRFLSCASDVTDNTQADDLSTVNLAPLGARSPARARAAVAFQRGEGLTASLLAYYRP